jgi:LmbE family N-acetylglucosaminyl deacetylase
VTVIVISPHLDDAVMSLGATMHSLTRRGINVCVLTVFAGDPESKTRPSFWDAKRGVATAAEATAARRSEDHAAAEILRVSTEWFPFDDGSYVSQRDPDAIWSQLQPAIDGSRALLVPGWPLAHPDHRWTTMLVVDRVEPTTAVAFYSELPYAAHPLSLAKAMVRGRTSPLLRYFLGEELQWVRTHVTRQDRRAKMRAVACYEGEVASLGYRARFGFVHDLLLRKEMLGYRSSEPLPRELVSA